MFRANFPFDRNQHTFAVFEGTALCLALAGHMANGTDVVAGLGRSRIKLRVE